MARIRIRLPENFPGSPASWQKVISCGSVSYLGNAVASHAWESSRNKASRRSRIDVPYVRFADILYHRRSSRGADIVVQSSGIGPKTTCPVIRLTKVSRRHRPRGAAKLELSRPVSK